MKRQQRAIFREVALKQYQQSQERVVLPRFISPPVVLCLWGLFGLVLLGCTIVWFWRLPTYVTVTGEIVTQIEQGQPTTVVVLIIPANQVDQIHVGYPVRVQLGQDKVQWTQQITTVGAGILSPTTIRSRFGLDGAAALLVQQPSAVALTPISPSMHDVDYTGSIVQASIQIGTRRVISLLPGFTNLF